MAETADDLSTPLGQETARKKRRSLRLPFSATQAIAVLVGLFLLAFLGFAVFNDNPLGGEPGARVAIRTAPPAEKPAATPAGAPPPVVKSAAEAAKPADPAGKRTITIIDGSSGARPDVVVSGDAPDKAESEAAPALMAGVDHRLLEKSRYGMIPIAADGLKPVTAYAGGTDADRARAARMPSIAIVIGGLGVGAAKTTDAIMKLPPAVTLAFTPYGTDPGKLAARARAQRHETFLQIPMEPYDFPDNDPGPQTLLTSLTADQNMDRLYWHLSRMQGYAGLTNFMGARFIATEPAMQPIIREAAKRGLGFFDDGSSPRSIAPQAAGSQAMPFGKGDIAIDAVPTPAEIDRALTKLEAAARERGVAVGTASALPVSIERIGVWTKTLGDRGILLVPLTTAMLKSKSS